MTATTAQSTDTWKKVEEAQTHLIAGLNPDEYQKEYAEDLEEVKLTHAYYVPMQESDALSTEITVTIGGVEYDIDDYVGSHPEDSYSKFHKHEAFDQARCETFGYWMIDVDVPFRVLVRPYFTDYAVWEFRHVA